MRMPRDYRKTNRSKSPSTRKNKKSNGLMHGPSFIIGLLVGAAMVLIGSYAPELLQGTAVAVNTPTVEPEQPLEFEFPKLLAESEVATNTQPYASDLPANQDTAPAEFLIQAASFRDADDAETLRAQLLLQDLPVDMTRVSLPDGNWYRVIVGPYDSQTRAIRALTKLREQDLRAIMLKRE